MKRLTLKWLWLVLWGCILLHLPPAQAGTNSQAAIDKEIQTAESRVHAGAGPRTVSPPPPYFGTNPDFKDIKAKLIAAGQKYHIPPHILFGIAYQESGWNQFRSDGRTVYHQEPDGRNGVGIMQITVSPNAADYSQLCTNIDYNIDCGAAMLGDASNGQSKWNVTPIIGDNDRGKLENWYYAVWAYNGFVCPNPHNYAPSVLSRISNGYGLWTPVTVTAPVISSCPPVRIQNTPTPVHIDADYDGVIDGTDTGSGGGGSGGNTLDVPPFSQQDARWGSHLIGFDTAATDTIARWGCVITSVAMVLDYYGSDTNPDDFNSWLKSHNGYANSDLLVWSAAPGRAPNVTYAGMNDWYSVPADLNVVNGELDAGYPVVAQVRPDSAMHWVVITGHSGSTYYINDPIDGAKNASLNSRYGNPASAIYRIQKYHGQHFNSVTTIVPESSAAASNGSPGFWRWGTPGYWHDATDTGDGGHMLWTYTNGNSIDNMGDWRPNLPATQRYEVSVWIPANHATTTKAHYEIYHADGRTDVVVNQYSVSNAWVSLGTYRFNAGTGGYLRLTDGYTEPYNPHIVVGFDTAKWEPRSDPLPPSASFNESNKNRWFGPNDLATQIVSWGLQDRGGGSKGMSQAWDSDPGGTGPAFPDSSDGYMRFDYLPDASREGQHTVYMRTWNADRSRSEVFSSGWYGYDSQAPTVTLSPGQPQSGTFSSTQEISWHIDDSNSGIQQWGQAWDADPGPTYTTTDGSLWVPQDGQPHTLHIHTWDNVGNNHDWNFGPYIVSLPKVYSLSGHINVSQNGTLKGLAGVSIAATRASDKKLFTTTTNASGVYIFSGLTADSYTIAPITTGLTYIYAPSPAQPQLLALTSGAPTRAGLNFTAKFSIGGTVYNTASKVLSGITVKAVKSGTTTVVAQMVSDANGKYSLALDPGTYMLSAVKASDATFHLVAGFTNPITVVAKVPTIIPAYDFHAIGITGHVLTPQNAGVSGIVVNLYASSDTALYTVVRTATTDAQGFFALDGIAAGTWKVVPTIPATFTCTPASAQVTVANSTVSVSFTATPYALSGTVSFYSIGAWHGVANMAVTATRQSDKKQFTVKTNATGAYGVTGLTADKYTITGANSNFSYVYAPTPQHAQPLTLAAQTPSLTGLNFQAHPIVSGTVFDTSGTTGLSGIKVSAAKSGSTTAIAQTTTNAQGKYTLTLDPGTYTLSATKSGQSAFHIGAIFTNPVTVRATVPASAPTYNFQVVGITGRVVTAQNAGVSGVKVSLYASTDTTLHKALKTVMTNAQGYFSFDGIASGSYLVAPVKKSSTTYSPTSRAVTLSNQAIVIANFVSGTSKKSMGLELVSPVMLSSSSVDVANSLVSLTFAGPLTPSAAQDITHYTVEVNGVEVAVEAAEVRGTTVVLLLPEGTLHAGDSVTVQWADLSDAQGRAMSGTAKLTAP